MVSEEGDEDESFSNFGQEPGFVPVQQQPYQPRDNGQRDHQQSYQPREQHQPREHREQRSQPPFQQQQPQPPIPDAGGVDRLPSFITGPQPQINGGGFEGNGGERERFPRRRRRPPPGPRPEGAASGPAAPSDDFTPGNE
jgi:hypothetical protein